jgi:hypothetical protein
LSQDTNLFWIDHKETAFFKKNNPSCPDGVRRQPAKAPSIATRRATGERENRLQISPAFFTFAAKHKLSE